MAYGLEDEFGDIVGKARRGLGLTEEELARQVGVTAGDIDAMERYVLKPDAATLERLARALELSPSCLAAIAREEWVPAPASSQVGPGLRVTVVPVPAYRENCYVAMQLRARSALVVDPGGEVPQIQNVLQQEGLTLVGILITHGHHDHTNGVAALQKATGAPVYAHVADAGPLWHAEPLEKLADTKEMQIDGFTVRAVPVPGHTAGSTTYVIGNAAFVGDTLFAGSIGRCALDYRAMLRAIRQHILSLPPETVLFPGHGPATTVGQERTHNPSFP